MSDAPKIEQHNWAALRAEASILFERLREGPSADPEADVRLMERAITLRALGLEAGFLVEATKGAPKH